MSVSSVDVLRNSFSSLKTSTGQKLVGIFLVIQLLNVASTYLMEEMSMISASVALGIVGGLAGAIVTIGGLRSLRDDEISAENFTSNVMWPFGRIVGSNLVTAIFAYLVSFLFLGPAILMATSSGVTSIASLTSASTSLLAASVVGGLLGIAALIYVSVTLMLAQPFIAIKDLRMFEALDKSIQSTKGSRLKIFLTFLGYTAVYVAIAAVFSVAGMFGPEQLVAQATSVVVGSVMAPVGLKILEEFSRELG